MTKFTAAELPTRDCNPAMQKYPQLFKGFATYAEHSAVNAAEIGKFGSIFQAPQKALLAAPFDPYFRISAGNIIQLIR